MTSCQVISTPYELRMYVESKSEYSLLFKVFRFAVISQTDGAENAARSRVSRVAQRSLYVTIHALLLFTTLLACSGTSIVRCID